MVNGSSKKQENLKAATGCRITRFQAERGNWLSIKVVKNCFRTKSSNRL